MSFVVAISGTSGAGKSTLIEGIAMRFSAVARMQFDHYIVLGTDGNDIQGWIDAGADPNLIKTPKLMTDLAALCSGQPVTPPGSEQVQPAPLILLEEPFGRQRKVIAPYIDLSVHLELPSDIALARRSLRTVRAINENASLEHQASVLANLGDQFAAYLGPAREAYQRAEAQARNGADLIFDARRPIHELVNESLALLATHKGPLPDTVNTVSH